MLTDEEFRLFRNLIYEESGIFLKDTRKEFLEHRLAKRMLANNVVSPYWYYRQVAEKKKELLILLDILTVNETSFFRNRPQIDLFRDIVLPELFDKKRGTGQKSLRIWSAGCSTGEEPYTLAMVTHEVINPYAGWQVRIFASDLSLTALDTAAKGLYDPDKVQATVEDHYITRYFDKSEGQLRVKDQIKKMVIFDFHNLKNDNGLADLDVIFCRNVMIYFNLDDQKTLVEKFYRSLSPGGYLIVGHAESLQGMDTPFQFIYNNKGTAYRKPEGREHV
ncbi:MAG: protein-glutamate O-methyltransferase CheR [Nitrospirae bacterium]|nr:MAG: protein-glutamate O-methyltransferase CheR [Nitrospirota bacterium]